MQAHYSRRLPSAESVCVLLGAFSCYLMVSLLS